MTDTPLTVIKKATMSTSPIDPISASRADGDDTSLTQLNAQLKRRITDLYNFDKEMLQVLQSTPEPSYKAKKRHFGPP